MYGPKREKKDRHFAVHFENCFLFTYITVLMFLQLLNLLIFLSVFLGRYFCTPHLELVFFLWTFIWKLRVFYVKNYDVIIYHFSEPVQVTISQRQTPSGLHERYGI